MGPKYSEVGKPGSGVYESEDGERKFHMTESDLKGWHGKGPHVNFEVFDITSSGPIKISNIHIPIKG